MVIASQLSQIEFRVHLESKEEITKGRAFSIYCSQIAMQISATLTLHSSFIHILQTLTLAASILVTTRDFGGGKWCFLQATIYSLPFR